MYFSTNNCNNCYFVTLTSTAPQAPSNIRVLMVEDVSDHLNVTWTQPAAPGPLCPITNNSIRWFLADTGDAVGQEEIITSAAYSITGLEAYTTYMVHVASKTDGGFGQEGTANNTTDQDSKYLICFYTMPFFSNTFMTEISAILK